MMRLRHTDWTKLLNSVALLNSDLDPATLSRRAMGAINGLVSGEITAIDFFDPDGNHTGEFWNDPPDAISPAEYEIFANVAHEHPFSLDVFVNKRKVALKTSDYLSKADFHQTAIYNEFYRRFSIDHQLLVAFSPIPTRTITCAISRSRINFTDEERALMNLSAPHLKNAINNSWKTQHLITAETSLNSALASKSTGAISLDESLNVLHMSDFAQNMLEKFYGSNELRKDGLPESLAVWISNNDNLRKIDPLISEFKLRLDGNDSMLDITLIFDGARDEKIVLLEESKRPSPVVLYSLGLTRRQSEVLFWISQGKTDKDISELLGISPRTVHKHLENVYITLGVETRTAAMSVAFPHLT